MARSKYAWEKFRDNPDHPVSPGAKVQGNYSSIVYVVEHTGDDLDGKSWWIQGRNADNPLGTGWFSSLGKRRGDEIEILDEKRPDDVLKVLSDPKASGQTELNL